MIPALSLINGFFANAWFFWGGLGAATAPTIIHLLNRRRFRTVQWAAMDFLKEALQRSRRIMQIRDVVLLVLRTFAIFLLGVALARPIITDGSFYLWLLAFPALMAALFFLVVGAAAWSSQAIRWSSLATALLFAILVGVGVFQQSLAESTGPAKFDGSKPLHAVVVIDNSMSMGYESALEGTQLDRAKARAKEYIRRLPQNSRVSVVPLCGSPSTFSADALTQEDAVESLNNIVTVDRSASVRQAVAESQRAAGNGPDLSTRVVLFSDQQASNWSDMAGDDLKRIGPLQVVDVSAGPVENSWISGLRLQDGLADATTPSTFIVEVQHVGSSPRRDVQVTLNVDGADVDSKTVELQPGGGVREVTFEYLFNTQQPEPGKPARVPVKATITTDQLPTDDVRHLVVNVAASLPVVFVDQYGTEEDPVKNKIGETRQLRRLLAPSRGATASQLVDAQHVKIDELNQQILASARLVVIGGVKEPGSSVHLLREYVQQGGQLVILAGAEFDPAAWNAHAWLAGEGILPAPLADEFLGAAPGEAGAKIDPFFLQFDSLSWHHYFRLAGASETDLRDLYAEPFFFKAVSPQINDELRNAMVAEELKRLDTKLRTLAQIEVRRERLTQKEADQGLSSAEQSQLNRDEAERLAIRPRWLSWQSPVETELDALVARLQTTLRQTEDDEWDAKIEEFVKANQTQLQKIAEFAGPRSLANFTDEAHTPYLVQRRIGRGNVLFFSSGVHSTWNTLRNTNTILIFDRILRSLVESTLPRRNFDAKEQIAMPLPETAGDVAVTLDRPKSALLGESSEPIAEALDVGFIGGQRRGVMVEKAINRGLYKLYMADQQTDESDQPTTTNRELWETFTVNGAPSESDLTPLPRDQFDERAAGSRVSWIGSGETISLAGEQQSAQNLWWYLILAVLGLMLLELAIVCLPNLKQKLNAGI